MTLKQAIAEYVNSTSPRLTYVYVCGYLVAVVWA